MPAVEGPTLAAVGPHMEGAQRGSRISKRGSQGSSVRSILSMSNLRGLFRKDRSDARNAPMTTLEASTENQEPTIDPAEGPSSTTTLVEVDQTAGGRVLASPLPTSLAIVPSSDPINSTGPAAVGNLVSQEMAGGTQYAVDVVNEVRRQPESPRRARLHEMSSILVDVLETARDARNIRNRVRMMAVDTDRVYARARHAAIRLENLFDQMNDETM